jgi:hypothetical protein
MQRPISTKVAAQMPTAEMVFHAQAELGVAGCRRKAERHVWITGSSRRAANCIVWSLQMKSPAHWPGFKAGNDKEANQSRQKFLKRSGASAVYLTVELIDLWPK